jgi:hypothetical protein
VYYPYVIGVQNLTTKNSIKLTVRFSSGGLAYIGIFDNLAPIPVATSQIISQNHMNVISNNISSVELTGLKPATTYSLYILSTSFTGVQMTYEDLLSTRVNISTLCCRSLQIQVQYSVIVEGKYYLNFLSFSTDVLPLSPMRSTLVLHSSNTSSSSQAFLPSSFNISSTSSLVSTVSLLPMLEGSYLILVTLTGTDSELYKVEYLIGKEIISSITLKVVSQETPLPAPSLANIIYGNDGATITINFDSPTNQAALPVHFTCNQLFDFPCSSNSRCQWIDLQTVTAFLSTDDSCVLPGNLIKLAPSTRLTAACSGRCRNYDRWPYLNVSSISLRIPKPNSPIIPTIVISMPSVLGECADLLLDLTSSIGNGGRSWRNLSIIVQNSLSNVNTSELQRFLNERYMLSPPSHIASSHFVANSQYTFIVTLCNFLGKCGSGSRSVSIVSTIVPLVTIHGPNIISLTRSQNLLLLSSVVLKDCSNTERTTSRDIFITWSIDLASTSSFTPLPSLQSISKDPMRFLLSAYSLQTNQAYVITAKVTSLVSIPTGVASVQVFVNTGKVVAVVQGNSMRNMRTLDTLVLDASNSYDEDQHNVYGLSAGLTFAWSCVLIEPILSYNWANVIDHQLFSSSFSLPALIIKTLNSASGTSIRLTLQVSDSTHQRSSSSEVTVSILPLLSSTIALTSNTVQSQINSGQSLRLTGSVGMPMGVSGNATWRISSGDNIDLSLITLNPLFMKLSATIQSYSLYLSFLPNSLTVGIRYIFELKCQLPYPGGTTTSMIAININSPPTPGVFTLNPLNGKEIVDTFTFLASQWTDKNLPLSYQYSYISLSNAKIVVKSGSSVSYSSTVLPAGPSTNQFAVTCIADIFDSLQANTTTSLTVKVLPFVTSSPPAPLTKGASSTNGTSKTLLDIATAYIQKNLNSSSDSSAVSFVEVDKVVGNIAIASYLLNTANCSQAPNCSSINRKPCYATSHTCGACLSSSMIGQFGDSNDQCYLHASIVRSSLSLKVCTGTCFGHGVCRYRSYLSSSLVGNCYEGDLSCYSECLCEPGYQLSKNCDQSDTEIDLKTKLRDQVIQSFATTMNYQDPSEQTISSWMNSIAEASQVTNEISPASVSSILQITSQAINIVKNEGFSSNCLVNILPQIDSATSAAVTNNLKRQNPLFISNDVSVISSMLKNYSTVVANEMSPGQIPNRFVGSSFRIHIQNNSLPVASVPSSALSSLSSLSSLSNHADINSCHNNVHVVMPNSNLESSIGYTASSVSFSTCSQSSSLKNISTLAVSLMTLSSAVYSNNGYKSDPFSFFLSSFPCGSVLQGEDHDCRVHLILQSDNSRLEAIFSEPKNISITCLNNDYRQYNVTCPLSGKNHVHTVSCKGKAETIIIHCPGSKDQPTCDGLVGETVASVGCKVVAYTATNTTCSCPLSALYNGSAPHYSADGRLDVTYVAMFEAVSQNLVKTVISAESLNENSAKKSSQVIVFLGTFFLSTILAMLLSHREDSKTLRKVHHEAFAKKLAQPHRSFAKSFTCKGKVSESSNDLPKLDISSSTKRRMGRVSSFQTMKVQTKYAELINTAQIAEDALPQILSSSKALTKRILTEIGRHHKWFGVAFYFSPNFPRILRVLALSSEVIVMLFVQSLTYVLTNDDDGSCETMKSREACLQIVSGFGTGHSRCQWVTAANEQSSSVVASSSTLEGYCEYIQPSNQMEIVVFVSVFSALCSIPISFLMDWIIHSILAAPTIDVEKRKTKDNKNESKQTGLSQPHLYNSWRDLLVSKKQNQHVLFSRTATERQFSSTKLSRQPSVPAPSTVNYERFYGLAETDYENLAKAITNYRTQIQDKQYRMQFDGK